MSKVCEQECVSLFGVFATPLMSAVFHRDRTTATTTKAVLGNYTYYLL